MKLPQIGEMRRRVAIYNVAFSSSGASALSEKRVLMLEAWAKHEIVGGQNYWDSVNVEETVTDRFIIRYSKSLQTTPPSLKRMIELDCEGITYRVRRVTDMNGVGRFTALECEALHG